MSTHDQSSMGRRIAVESATRAYQYDTAQLIADMSAYAEEVKQKLAANAARVRDFARAAGVTDERELDTVASIYAPRLLDDLLDEDGIMRDLRTVCECIANLDDG